MEEIPKKIVRSDLVCFLCACRLNKDKVRVLSKSAEDIPSLIKRAIDIDAAVFCRVTSSSAPPATRNSLDLRKLQATSVPFNGN